MHIVTMLKPYNEIQFAYKKDYCITHYFFIINQSVLLCYCHYPPTEDLQHNSFKPSSVQPIQQCPLSFHHSTADNIQSQFPL